MPNPLWMPQGSVRSLLAIAVVGSFAAHAILIALGEATLEAEVFASHLGLAGLVSNWYFKARETPPDA